MVKTRSSYNFALLSCLQYIFSILVMVIHSGRLFESDSLHFIFKSFFGRMAVPYFLVCTAFFLREQERSGGSCQLYFKGLIKKYVGWSLLYLPLAFLFFEHLNLSYWFMLPALLVVFLYLGFSHTLWYIPALFLGWHFLHLLCRRLGQGKTLVTIIALYVLGTYETYSALFTGQLIETYMAKYFAIFQTTRNGLFFVPIFLFLGILLYDRFDHKSFSKATILKTVIFLSLLGLEFLFIFYHQGRDKNFFLSAPVFISFLFNLSIRSRFWKNRDLSYLKVLSSYYFFIHPMYIQLTSYMMSKSDYSIYDQGKFIFLVTLILTHLSSIVLIKLVNRHKKYSTRC